MDAREANAQLSHTPLGLFLLLAIQTQARTVWCRSLPASHDQRRKLTGSSKRWPVANTTVQRVEGLSPLPHLAKITHSPCLGEVLEGQGQHVSILQSLLGFFLLPPGLAAECLGPLTDTGDVATSSILGRVSQVPTG